MYIYEAERSKLFTEEGQVMFLKVRDRVKALLDTAGAFRLTHISIAGDSWLFLACIDRLVELGEIAPLRNKDMCWGQYQVYSTPQIHNY
jgi:hypothetical protein